MQRSRAAQFSGLAALLGAAAVMSCGSSDHASGGTSAGAAGTLPAQAGATMAASGSSVGGASGAAATSGGTVTGGASEVGGVNSGGNSGAGATAGGGAAAGGSMTTGGGATAGGGGGTASGGASNPVWNGTLPKFTKHTIGAFTGGYTTLVADIDGDGLPDVVALSSGAPGVVWFKNPSWKKYTITTAVQSLIFMAPYDVDGDGDLDLALVSDFDLNNANSGGTISWAEAPDDPTQNEAWTVRKIDAIPTTHRVRWANLDGMGKKELVALPMVGIGSPSTAEAKPAQLKTYTIPSAPKDAQANWSPKVLDDTHLKVAHSLRVVDWDGDANEDLLTAANDGVFLFRPSLGKGAEHLAAGASGQAPDKGSSDVVLGSLGGARFIATIDPWHGTDAVVYTPGAAAADLWSREVVGAADLTHGHGLAVADLNGDGYDEVICGGGQGKMNEFIYRYTPSSHAWDKILLDSGAVAVSEIEAHDLNGDGAIDLVAIGASPTNNVVWYESVR